MRRPPLMPALPARAVGFLCLLAFGTHHWMAMLGEGASARAWYAVAAGAATAAGLWACGLLRPGSVRRIAAGAVAGAGAVLALLGAGAGHSLAPGRWDDLVAGVVSGVEGLPGMRVPYRGIDPWLELVLALGGTALAVLAAALAFWPRRGLAGRPVPALLVLVSLYAVPAVALAPDGGFARGAVLGLLVLAFLRLERLPAVEAPRAAVAGVVATVLALALAPALDGLDPWWDYESWALDAASARSTAFQWDHDYQELRWPRDGRELLRVRSRVRGYWKADQLDVFNGRAWVRDRNLAGTREALSALTLGVPSARLQRWTARFEVSVRNLVTETFVTAGSVKDIDLPGQAELPTTRSGIFRARRALRRGDAYRVLAYVPRPSARELRTASGVADPALTRYTRVGVRSAGDGAGMDGEPRTTVVDVPSFGAPPRMASVDPLADTDPAAGLLARSELDRAWALARRLRRRSPTPYAYVRRLEAHLARGFLYSETPPPGSATLDGFLFETRRGFCQQFSGAMALLLRLGGVPARVATGFAPGRLDEDTGQYVVRDTDAHSWVEVWFPGVGWVVRDPTPADAPPGSQVGDARPRPAVVGARDIGTTTRPGATALADTGHDRSWVALGVLAAAALAAAGFAGRRAAIRARRLREGSPVAELERALRIAGEPLLPGTTLAGLEQRFAGAPRAAAYVRALRAQRFRGSVAGPTPEDRRALRRALGSGRGPLRRARSWLAVPPQPGFRGRQERAYTGEAVDGVRLRPLPARHPPARGG